MLLGFPTLHVGMQRFGLALEGFGELAIICAMASADDSLNRVPHYVPVVFLKTPPETRSWKAWRCPRNGDIEWDMLCFLPHLLPSVNIRSAHFRVNRVVRVDFGAWSHGLLQLEGLQLADVFNPSFKSCAQRDVQVGPENHKVASMSSYGLLSLFAWSSTRTKHILAQGGSLCLLAVLHATLPGLSEPTLMLSHLFDNSRELCDSNVTDRYCEHMHAARTSWANGGDDVAVRVSNLLTDLANHIKACPASLHMYAGLLSTISDLIHNNWENQACKGARQDLNYNGAPLGPHLRTLRIVLL
jgi:hypothetical protein